MLPKTKNKHHQWILHIQISLSTKFHFKQLWILRTNFPKKGISGPKQKKFTSQSLNWQFWFLDQISPKLVFQKITLLHVSMVITHYIKLICKVANKEWDNKECSEYLFCKEFTFDINLLNYLFISIVEH